MTSPTLQQRDEAPSQATLVEDGGGVAEEALGAGDAGVVEAHLAMVILFGFSDVLFIFDSECVITFSCFIKSIFDVFVSSGGTCVIIQLGTTACESTTRSPFPGLFMGFQHVCFLDSSKDLKEYCYSYSVMALQINYSRRKDLGILYLFSSSVWTYILYLYFAILKVKYTDTSK